VPPVQPREHQQELVFPTWGGKRRGAGRKPKGAHAGAPHDTRPALSRHEPVHVTTHLRPEIPSLRGPALRAVIERCFEEGCERFGFRLVHYSIQSSHLHILAEVEDRHALSRGMQGLLVRIAKRLNKFLGRKGSVFADRYFAKPLTTPKVVRNALVYVLQNARKHGMQLWPIDPCSSGSWFDGWERPPPPPRRANPGVPPRTWLLSTGWKRHGLIRFEESPRTGLE